MNQGRIIEYIDQGKFVCSLCLQDRGNRLHLLTASNREVNLSSKRAILVSGSGIDTEKPREDLLAHLKRTEEIREHLKSQVDAGELWELIVDEQEHFHHQYLTQLVFGDAATDDHLSALVRALFEDHLYFRLKEGRFLPNTAEKIRQMIKRQEAEAFREARLLKGSEWLKGITQGREVDAPDCKRDVIHLLSQLAIYGTEATEYQDGKELLGRAEIADIGEARRLLVDLGVWDQDENLDLHRLDIQTSFSESQINESIRLAGSGFDGRDREDLRHIPVLTIDGPLTRDFDDAISLEVVGDILEVGVHIADVAAVIPPDSLLDKGSAERVLSIYFPRRQIPMIPPVLSEDALSLKQGCDRQAISLLARFEKGGELLDYRFVPSIVRVRENLIYDKVNADLSEAGVLQSLCQMSRILREKRNKTGALSLSLPELQIMFDADSAIRLELVPQDTPSRLIVAELMILYNRLIARFCKENRIPILFRTQTEPSERLSLDDDGYLYYVFKQRRKLNPLLIDTTPKPHSGLGVDVYTHATSPIRRYLDIVAQRQVGSALLGNAPVYDEKKLEEIRIFAEPMIKAIGRMKQNRIRYWILRYLQQHQSDTFTALVLYEMKNKYRILLKDFLLMAEIKREPRLNLNPADRILVRVRKVDPWTDTLELAYARTS
jgi:exoribonuclease-2